MTVGLRIAEEDEDSGIDQVEIGMEVYPEFGPASPIAPPDHARFSRPGSPEVRLRAFLRG